MASATSASATTQRAAAEEKPATASRPQLKEKDTADLFTEISRGIDKWLWFVEAHSQASK